MLSLLNKLRNVRSYKLNKLPKATHLVSSRAGNQTEDKIEPQILILAVKAFYDLLPVFVERWYNIEVLSINLVWVQISWI